MIKHHSSFPVNNFESSVSSTWVRGSPCARSLLRSASTAMRFVHPLPRCICRSLCALPPWSLGGFRCLETCWIFDACSFIILLHFLSSLKWIFFFSLKFNDISILDLLSTKITKNHLLCVQVTQPLGSEWSDHWGLTLTLDLLCNSNHGGSAVQATADSTLETEAPTWMHTLRIC